MSWKESFRQILKRLPFALSRNHLYDLQTRKIIKKLCREDSVCIDVGAHRGEVLEWMIKYAPKAKHYAFEAIPKYAAYLQEKFGDRCHIKNYALSHQKGKTQFHFVKSNPSYSGIKKRRYDRRHEEIEIIDVQMAPLDDLIPESEKIALIKIDVEGAELWVLKGGIKTIKHSKPVIIFETGKGGLDHYDAGPSEIFEFFQHTLEYSVSLLGSWLKQGKALDQTEFERQFQQSLNYYFVAYPE